MKNSLPMGNDILSYFNQQLPNLSKRLNFQKSESELLNELLFSAYLREVTSKEELGLFIKSTSESKALINFFMRKLLLSWKIIGEQNLSHALEYHTNNGRVIFMLNHTGVIDPPIVNYMLNHFVKSSFMKLIDQPFMTWVAGMRVWNTVFLRIFARCSEMVTIYSEKYISEAKGTENFSERIGHNVGALQWMKKNQTTLWLFPEGTWSNKGRLLRGVPDAMNVPRILSKNSNTNVLIVPCYLQNAHRVMPHLKKQGDQFYDFLQAVRPGKNVTLHIGEPEYWNNIAAEATEKNAETNQKLVDHVMSNIAKLAPLKARGAYA